MASAMGHHGQVVAAVGTGGTLWVWQSGQVGGDNVIYNRLERRIFVYIFVLFTNVFLFFLLS